MKSLIKISSFLVIGLLLIPITSCDDTLDEPLDQEFLVEDVDYSNTEDMFTVLIGAYGNLQFLQWETFPLIAVRGDDVNAAGDQFPLQEADAFRYNPAAWIHNSVWLNLYGDMFAFNAAIDEIKQYREFVDDKQLADQYIAEVKVMKGWELLQMIRLWGEVFIPETPLAVELYDQELYSFEEGLQYISDLMDEAIPQLPDMHPNQRADIPGGMTRYTALTVKALANLELKNWQGVVDATDEIISSGAFSLEPDYYNLFKTAGKLNDEIILELQYSDYGQGSGESNYYLHRFFGPQGWSPKVSGAGGGWGFWEPTQKYIKFMLDREEELRLQTSVLFTNAGIAELESDPKYSDLPEWISNITPNGDTINDYARADFASGKHYLPSEELVPGRTRYGSGKNFICIRYSEVLLMHAEAITQGASSSVLSADAAVNEVRGRAGLEPLSGVTLNDVLEEKFAEFAMEWGIRFYDLVRHGRTEELNHLGRTYTDDKRFIVYPQAQIDLLPQLSND
jgi:starch-binding outer membrane protein, SusD/RagB family